ncbi:LamG domain-containing protein, partial [bacterium]
MHRPHFAWVLLGLAAFSLAACGGGASSPGSTLPPAVGQPGSSGNPTPAALPPVASLNSTSTRATSSYAQTVLAAKPIAYYQLDGGGSVAYDSSANGLNGTIGSGVATSTAGLLASSGDTSMRFPGTRGAGGVVSVPPNAKLKVSSQLTMEALLRFSTVPASNTVPLSYGSDAGYAPYDLYFANGHIDAQFNLSSGALVVSSPSQLQPNVTYHVVATYNGATATLYLNGAAVASKSKTGTFVGYDNTHGFAIGDDAGYSDPGFAGTVDDVAIYGTPLTASQVQAHYAAATSSSAPSTPAPTATPVSLAPPAPNPNLSPTPKPVSTPTTAPVAQPVTNGGNVATFAGCPIFTAGGWYNKPVAGAPTDPNSAAYINGAVAAG